MIRVSNQLLLPRHLLIPFCFLDVLSIAIQTDPPWTRQTMPRSSSVLKRVTEARGRNRRATHVMYICYATELSAAITEILLERNLIASDGSIASAFRSIDAPPEVQASVVLAAAVFAVHTLGWFLK